MRRMSLLFFCFLTTGNFQLALPWGCEGHQIVALLARVHLTPVATNAVDQLLRRNPVDLTNRYCTSLGGDLMADVASWADQVRDAEKNGPWHYVDIPLGVPAKSYNASVNEWCPPVGEASEGKNRPGCVLSALEYNLAILRDGTKPDGERAQALRYVIHFVGDMHQPLHTTDNNDQGGNCTSLRVFGEERPGNLHSLWDSRLLTRHLKEASLTSPQYATEVDRKWGHSAARMGAGTPLNWAWEGHRVAQNVTYGDLQPSIPAQTTLNPGVDCKVETARVEVLKIEVGDRYYRKAVPVIEEQLARGGYRLAAILNQVLTK